MGCVAGGKLRHIGYFRTAEEAAEAYAKEFLHLHGTALEVGDVVHAAARGSAPHVAAVPGPAEVGGVMCAAAGATAGDEAPQCASLEPPFDLSPWRSNQNSTGYKGVSRHDTGCGYVAKISTGEILCS